MKKRKMDDNELALRIIAYVLSLEVRTNELNSDSFEKKTYRYNPYFNSNKRSPSKGDVALACSSGYVNLNEFTIGEINEVIDGGLRIKDFKTGRLCDYTNEEFLCIKKEELGFRWMFGKERKIYDALYGEWRKEGSWLKFYKFSFVDNHLRWSVREYFKDDEYAVVEFDTTDDMSVDDIVSKAFEILDEKLEMAEKEELK